MSTDTSKQQEFVLRTLEERNIRFVRLWFTDVLGFLKSVAIAPAELENAFDSLAINTFYALRYKDIRGTIIKRRKCRKRINFFPKTS